MAAAVRPCYDPGMTRPLVFSLPSDLATDLERRFFWWDPVGTQARSDLRILAQAMQFAGFADVRALENELGAACLADAMLMFEAGWLDDRSWEFWRGRLSLAAGRPLPEEPPRRALQAATDRGR